MTIIEFYQEENDFLNNLFEHQHEPAVKEIVRLRMEYLLLNVIRIFNSLKNQQRL